MSSDWERLLASTRAVDFLKDQVLITTNGDNTVRKAITFLKDNSISALVVVDKHDQAIGFFDVLDLASWALHCWNKTMEEQGMPSTRDTSSFYDKPLKNILNFSQRDEFLTLPLSASLHDCFTKFREQNFRSHRIALLNDNGCCEKIVAMSDLVRFASSNLNALPFSNEGIAKLGMLHPCMTLPKYTSLWEALKFVMDKGISGVALVDESLKLDSNFSAGDFKNIFPGAFDLFYRPVKEFVFEVKAREAPFALNYQTTFGDLIQCMAEEKIHRIFLTTEGGKPSHIVSCTDVVKMLTPTTQHFGMSTSQ